MKALSVKQPWAYLICAGIKDIENRTWATKFRGRVYIHASGSHGKKFNINLTDEQMIAAFGSIADEVVNGDFQFGAIIGHVDIIDCVINHSSIWAEKSMQLKKPLEQDYFAEDGTFFDVSFENDIYGYSNQKPIYNWVLANPVLFEEPILNVKGKLSFCDCSEYLDRKEVQQ